MGWDPEARRNPEAEGLLRIGELLGTTGTLKEQIFDGEQAHETYMLFQWNYWEAKRCGGQSIFYRALPSCLWNANPVNVNR